MGKNKKGSFKVRYKSNFSLMFIDILDRLRKFEKKCMLYIETARTL